MGWLDAPWLRRVTYDAALAGLVTLLMALPIVGLQTVATPAGLVIRTRLGAVALVAAVVFAGRFLLSVAAHRPPMMGSGGLGGWHGGRWLGLAVALALVGLPFFGSTYLLALGTSVLIYVMLGWGLNIVVGLAGLLDLGYVAFYGVGAYTLGLLSNDFGWSFWEALPLCGLFAAVFGVALGFPVLRLRGDYLAIVTLGFGEIIRIVLLNWSDVTGGPNGVGDIPRPTFFGLPISRFAPSGGMTFGDFFHVDYAPQQKLIFLYFVILAMALATNFFTLRMRRLPIGRAWEALREDEIACRALGINATNVKLSAFGTGAMFGGLAGALYASRMGFISPESFNFNESAQILMIVVLGGMGSQLGVVLAALLVVLIPEFARPLEDYRMLLFGAAMVAIMVTRPRGLLAHRQPSALLNPVAP